MLHKRTVVMAVNAATALGRVRSQAFVLAAWAWLADLLIAERDRWVLWFPVGIGVGIAVYFALRFEPPFWVGPAGLAVAGVIAILGSAQAATWLPATWPMGSWRVEAWRMAGNLLALGLATSAAGFTAAQLRTASVAAPVLAAPLTATVVGRIVAVEPRVNGDRLLLDTAVVSGLDRAATPARLRLSTRNSAGASDRIRPGDWVRLRATLLPPPGPAAPGAYDFQRRAWFQRLGAVGFARGQPAIVAAPVTAAPPRFVTATQALAEIRQRIFFRVTARLAGATGAVAAALMMGERGAIPADVLAAMRDSGLAHLLAISGLHVGLVAGFLFFCVRGGLALVPAVALRYPIKKWAAVIALLGAFGYLLLAGAPVPTQRAFVMIGLVLTAILLDRRGISMRLVAWAAIAILLVRPESLLGASFQLSFAAVLALVAGYEAIGPGLRRWYGDAGLIRHAVLYGLGVALTTVIASTATAPFAVFHFDRLVAYGLVANLLAVPITALWVMPWAVAALLLMPFGLEWLALVPMGWGVAAVIAIARTIASWPGAVLPVPAMPTVGIAVVALGGLWLCLWRRGWRIIGLVGIVGGLVTLATVRAPDVLIAGDARLIGLRAADGTMLISHTRRAAFTRDVWLRGAGTSAWSSFAAATAAGRLGCDPLGCIHRLQGQIISIVEDERALAEDCRLADILVSTVPVRGPCPRPQMVIDRFDLHRDGSHAVWLGTGDGARVAAANPSRGARPWVPRSGAGAGGF